jgi:hypothetical protein
MHACIKCTKKKHWQWKVTEQTSVRAGWRQKEKDARHPQHPSPYTASVDAQEKKCEGYSRTQTWPVRTSLAHILSARKRTRPHVLSPSDHGMHSSHSNYIPDYLHNPRWGFHQPEMVLGELEANGQRQGKLPPPRLGNPRRLAMCKSLLCCGTTMQSTRAWYSAVNRAAW